MIDFLPTLDSDGGPIEASAVVVFDNAGVPGVVSYSPKHRAVEQSRAYTATAGPISVLAGNVFHVIIANPIDSGVNVFITNRLFGNDRAPGAASLEYRAHANPTAILANLVGSPNFDLGEPSSLTTVRSEAAAAGVITMGGLLGSSQMLPNGVPLSRDHPAKIRPGRALGFTISGAGNNLVQAARLDVTFEWYEEAV